MGNTKLLTKLLCLKDVKITWFNFENYNKELHLGLKPYKTGCCCSTCGRRCPIVRTMEIRLPFLSWLNGSLFCPCAGFLWEQARVCGAAFVHRWNLDQCAAAF